jgi:hypothetical protein
MVPSVHLRIGRILGECVMPHLRLALSALLVPPLVTTLLKVAKGTYRGAMPLNYLPNDQEMLRCCKDLNQQGDFR